MTIQIPPELFAEWLAEACKVYLESALIAGFVAEKAAQYAADQELEACCKWIEQGPYGKKGPYGIFIAASRSDLSGSLRAARRPKPHPKEQAAKELMHLRNEMKRHGLDVPATPALARAIESIPDADS